MIFGRENGGRVKISVHALAKMNGFRQIQLEDKEAGGVIVGRRLLNSEGIVIDDVSTPMANDIRRRTFFRRNRADHQDFVVQRWSESNGTCNYFGEWHTHPQAIPLPSEYDRHQWRRILKQVNDVEELFFIIVGTKGIHLWKGSVLNGTIVRIHEMRDQQNESRRV